MTTEQSDLCSCGHRRRNHALLFDGVRCVLCDCDRFTAPADTDDSQATP